MTSLQNSVRFDLTIQKLLISNVFLPSLQLSHKFDLQGAYRLVPVHPVDPVLLGMKWDGAVYVDAALPFGLLSAPKLFTAVADALLWILGSHGVREGIHYLDDFLIRGQAGTDECERTLALSLELCNILGVTVAKKTQRGLSRPCRSWRSSSSISKRW